MFIVTNNTNFVLTCSWKLRQMISQSKKKNPEYWSLIFAHLINDYYVLFYACLNFFWSCFFQTLITMLYIVWILTILHYNTLIPMLHIVSMFSMFVFNALFGLVDCILPRSYINLIKFCCKVVHCKQIITQLYDIFITVKTTIND